LKLAAVGAGLAALALGGPAAATTTDLVTRAVVAPAYAHPGGEVVARAKVKARYARARPSTLRFYLSADRRRSRADRRLVGSARVPALRAGHSFAVAIEAGIANSAKVGSFYVLGCADDRRRVRERRERNNCTASRTKVAVTAAATTSRNLIEAELEAGSISEEQALLYRAYAAFGAPGLPARFRGDNLGYGDDSVMREVADAWPTLSPTTQAALEPFFRPPMYEGSYAKPFAPRAPLRSRTLVSCESEQLRDKFFVNVPTANGKVRVWWRNGRPTSAKLGTAATKIAQEIDATIWPKLTTLMGREPLSDAGEECFNGEDGRLDIYLMDGSIGKGDHALTVAYPGRCDQTPVFIVINALYGITRWEIAHEIFHAFQFSYDYKGPCKEYALMDEATATWAGNYVYPTDNVEHEYDDFISRIWNLYCCLGPLGYPDWTLYYSLTQHQGNPKIPSLYANVASYEDDIKALDATITGGLTKFWGTFVKDTWNQPPLDDSFRVWDGIEEVAYRDPAPNDGGVSLVSGQHVRKETGNVSLHYMEKDELHVWKFNDPDIRYIKITNPGVGAPDGMSLLVLVEYADGHWSHPDWLHEDKVTFCRDEPSENVHRIFLWYADGNHPDGWAGASAYDVDKDYEVEYRDACEAYQYKILGATLTTTALGHAEPDVCSFADPPITSMEKRHVLSQFSGDAQPTPLVSKLELTRLSGERYVTGTIRASVEAIQKDAQEGLDGLSVKSCKFTPTGVVPCSWTAPEQTQQTTVSFDISFQPWNDGTAAFEGIWSVPSPEIGVASGSYPTECVFPYIYFSFPLARATKSESVFKFTGTGQQTISTSGTEHFERVEFGDLTTTLDYTWSLSLTFVRVDENGNPL
jgi:hypothetical protein